VHGVAEPATSGVVAYFPENHGPSQPDNLSPLAPVIGLESGTRITANSRTVATDGGLRSFNSGDPVTMLGGSPDASHLGKILALPWGNAIILK
jgi:hypothetical protein